MLGKIKGGNIGEAVTPAPDEAVNVLVLGLIGDPNQTNNYEIKRTDTIMVAQYDPKKKDLDLVSIPRDTLITENGRNIR
ncbi:LCP family protein [Romboutsia timonensis]|uniref:LCP family glycopolymer transferase n=1 Tax=Romboutsia timonensis TaxID=1776391 RepID=UPI00399471F4